MAWAGMARVGEQPLDPDAGGGGGPEAVNSRSSKKALPKGPQH